MSLALTEQHADVRDDKQRSSTQQINKHSAGHGSDEVPDLQSTIDSGLRIRRSVSNALKDKVDVVRHETVATNTPIRNREDRRNAVVVWKS